MNESVDQQGVPPEYMAQITRIAEDRFRARTTINGKTLESFGANERQADEALRQKIEQAALNREVSLQ